MSAKPKRAVVVLEGVAGKQIRQLSLSEPYPKAQDIYLSIEFEDGTVTLIEIACVPCFGINHLVRDAAGELQPTKKSMRGSIRMLVEKRGSVV